MVASPYMKGGRTTAIPWRREVMSKGVNKLLSQAAGGGIATVTGMVRVYDGRFIRSLDLKAMGPEINTEILYKAQIMRARIVEIPAHLDWSFARDRRHAPRRHELPGLAQHAVVAVLVVPLPARSSSSCSPGLILLAIAAYSFGWCVWHVFQVWGQPSAFGNSGLTGAIQNAYDRAPARLPLHRHHARSSRSS